AVAIPSATLNPQQAAALASLSAAQAEINAAAAAHVDANRASQAAALHSESVAAHHQTASDDLGGLEDDVESASGHSSSKGHSSSNGASQIAGSMLAVVAMAWFLGFSPSLHTPFSVNSYSNHRFWLFLLVCVDSNECNFSPKSILGRWRAV
ncbi:hypothetical protein DL89DRAFT_266248, partial [Linderina pennispora]